MSDDVLTLGGIAFTDTDFSTPDSMMAGGQQAPPRSSQPCFQRTLSMIQTSSNPRQQVFTDHRYDNKTIRNR
jgi:hypothetical protein